jgi:high mobility group protein B1
MRTADVAKLVSQAWKALGEAEKAIYLDFAKRDKARYELEKSTYTGPWKVLATKIPAAPKRPMSAFLAFSNARRKDVTEANPMHTNGEVSKILADMWKKAPPQQKKLYQLQEGALRKKYKSEVLQHSSQEKDGEPISMSSVLAAAHPLSDEESLECLSPFLEAGFLERKVAEPSLHASFSSSHEIRTDESSRSYAREVVSQHAGSLHLLRLPRHPRYGSPLAEDKIWDTLTKDHFGEAPFPLQPMISTDVGGFLAAAAMLEVTDEW